MGSLQALGGSGAGSGIVPEDRPGLKVAMFSSAAVIVSCHLRCWAYPLCLFEYRPPIDLHKSLVDWVGNPRHIIHHLRLRHVEGSLYILITHLPGDGL